MGTPLATANVVTGYYGATFLFVVLDYLLDFNIRLTFLDPWPVWRVAYYGVCVCFFGLMLWRPRWSNYIGAAESLLTLTLLIISMALRVMIVTDEMIAEGRGFVTARELRNFVIAGTISYIALLRGALAGKHKFH